VNWLQLQRFLVLHTAKEKQDVHTEAREWLSGQGHLADQVTERNQTSGAHVMSTIPFQSQFEPF